MRTIRTTPRPGRTSLTTQRTAIQMLMRFAYAKGKGIDEATDSISRRLQALGYGLGVKGPARIPQEERADTQAALRACFGQLVSGAPFTWAPPATTIEITYIGIERTPHGTVERNCALAPPGAFWFAVVEVLRLAGSLVRRCAHCPKLYVRSGRMDYCSQACSQRARSAKWYAAHRKVALDRKHQAYKRKAKLRQRGAKATRNRHR
jgi:hypothetical protein